MKVFVAVLTIGALVACATAAVLPEMIDEELQYETNPLEDAILHSVRNSELFPSHSRQRRFTCDAFSFSSAWVTPNHSACALKCVAKGRKGGHCENNNCVCRNDRYVG